jgi:hypothetical protein
MAKSVHSNSVPQSMRPKYDAVAELTDAFCRDRLNDEYRDLARTMIAALCRKRPSPLMSGQPKTWACGVVYVLGQVNFLSDRATKPYMPMAEVAAGFGVGESTASGKARTISDALQVSQMDPAWMLRERAAHNPLVWLVQINGFLADIRKLPREMQQIAYDEGLIPYIPTDA